MPQFTKEMKRDGWTIVIPNMSEIHFDIIKRIFDNYDYKVLLLENNDPTLIEEGLKYVHNDMCYPCLLVIGQMLDAIKRGLVDKDRCALAISQTGGGCRASNYYFLLLKALKRAGLENIPVISFNLQGMNSNPGLNIPVISFNLQGMNSNPGLKITKVMILQAFTALIYGDMLMMVSNQTRPYEINKGDTDRLVKKWTDELGKRYAKNSGYFGRHMRDNLNKISDDFASIKQNRIAKVKVGVVGEIYMKYSRLGNNNLKDFLESQDCEVMLPPMLGFVFYGFTNGIHDAEFYGGRKKYSFLIKNIAMPYLEKFERWMIEAIERHEIFHRPATFKELEEYGKSISSPGCKMGEGWLLTAEMVELVEKGYGNIVCTQPFGCLPNHICGKGMIRPIKERYPQSNIVPIDYDPSATKVNQENRIKLMLSIARENLENEKEK